MRPVTTRFALPPPEPHGPWVPRASVGTRPRVRDSASAVILRRGGPSAGQGNHCGYLPVSFHSGASAWPPPGLWGWAGAGWGLGGTGAFKNVAVVAGPKPQFFMNLNVLKNQDPPLNYHRSVILCRFRSVRFWQQRQGARLRVSLAPFRSVTIKYPRLLYMMILK